jgi:hypothetical protein
MSYCPAAKQKQPINRTVLSVKRHISGVRTHHASSDRMYLTLRGCAKLYLQRGRFGANEFQGRTWSVWPRSTLTRRSNRVPSKKASQLPPTGRHTYHIRWHVYVANACSRRCLAQKGHDIIRSYTYMKVKLQACWNWVDLCTKILKKIQPAICHLLNIRTSLNDFDYISKKQRTTLQLLPSRWRKQKRLHADAIIWTRSHMQLWCLALRPESCIPAWFRFFTQQLEWWMNGNFMH